MNEIVIPFGKKHDLPLEPIDWWPDTMREQYTQFMSDFQKTSEGSKFIKEFENEWTPHLQSFPDYKDVTPEYTHSAEFAQKDSLLRTQIKEIIGEGPQNLFWTTRALKINQNLEKVIQKYSGKRITAVVGAFHRADIELFFKNKVIINSIYN